MDRAQQRTAMVSLSAALRRQAPHKRACRAILFCTLLLIVAAVSPSTAQQAGGSQAAGSAAGGETICQREAPWRLNHPADKREWDPETEAEKQAPKLVSNHSAADIDGLWQFALKNLEPGGDVATAGRLLIYQEGAGYTCEGGCGYKVAADNARWMHVGKRWGHENIGLRTPENSEDIPPADLKITGPKSFRMPEPQHYPFAEITGTLGDDPDRMTGTWRVDSGDEVSSGPIEFTRVKPKLTSVKFISTVEHKVRPGEQGCVALDYDASWWGPGNNMRGNRPGFNVEIYGENFHWFAEFHYKAWIDPDSRLELGSGYPKVIFAKDANGQNTGQVIGLRLHVNVWEGSRWGPKTLFVEGQAIPFDFYVRPAYPFEIDPPKLVLVHGHFPEKPKTGMTTHLGFRLVNLPGHAVENATLDLSFHDADSFAPAASVEILDQACQRKGEGAVRCQFEEIGYTELKETEFRVPMPDGGLLWVAEWKAEGTEEPAVRTGRIDADDSPKIIHAFSLSDQTGAFRPQTRDYRYPYPGTSTGQQKREVILFGKNLPQKFGDEASIESLDPAISYLPRYGIAYRGRYDAAWKELSKRIRAPIEALKKEYQLFLLDAQISGRPLPGEKSLKLNGTLASWDLRFGGLSAKLEFIRPAEGRQEDETLQSAYVPERVRVRVTTTAALPLDHIPLVLHLQRTNRNPAPLRQARGEPAASTLRKIALTATTNFGSPTVYLSEPIRLVDKGNARLSPPPQPGDIAVDIFTSGRGTDQLAIEIEPGFAAKSFLLPILPASAALPISRTPARHRSVRDPNQESDYLFKSALAEAAQCHDIQVEDWGKLTLEESDYFYNLIVITHSDHIRKTNVKFGHHAAMLLMRRMFVELLNEQISTNQEFLQSQLALKGFLELMRLELDDETIPINRIKVTAPDGSQVNFGGMPLYENLDFLARRYNSTPAEMAQWRLTAAAEAINRIGAGASEAAERARRVDKCDVEELLELVGIGFEAVNARLRPRLMRLVETRDAGGGATRLYWEPDLAARYWIDNVSSVSKRLAAQRQTAKDDNARLSLLFSVVTAPIVAGSAPAVAMALTGASLTWLGADTAGEWVNVYSSQIELDFSRDAAVVLGFARNDAAIKKAVTWHSAYNKTLLAAGPATIDLLQVKEQVAIALFRSKDITLKGRLAVRNMSPGGLRALREAQRRNAQIFALRARARALTEGAEALDAVERRAIAAVEEDFRAAQTELIRNAEGSRTLGFGDRMTLPPPFDQRTARVGFKPVAIPQLAETAVPSRFVTLGEYDETIKMARLADDAPTPITSGVKSAPRPATPPPPRPAAAEPPARAPPEKLSLDQRLALANTPDDRARVLANETLLVQPSPGAKPIQILLGGSRGRGSFSVALHPRHPYADFDTLVKVGFGGHDAADVFGKAAIKQVGSRNVVTPREVLSIDIPAAAVGHQRHFKTVAIVEDLGDTGKAILARGPFSEAQRQAIRKGLDDINDAGYVMLDFKLNNFALPVQDRVVKLGLFDFGGIVRVKGGNPALAREIQNVVAGPWSEVARALETSNGLRLSSNFATEGRKILIEEKYASAFDDLDKLGISSIDELAFLPTAGNDFDAATAALFTAAVRSK